MTGLPPGVTFGAPRTAEQVAAVHTASWRRWYRGIYADEYLDGVGVVDYHLGRWRARFEAHDPVNAFLLGAFEGGMLLGFAYACRTQDPMDGVLVDNLHVPDARGKGLGTALLARAAAWAAERFPGLPLHLAVFEHNEQAVAFYRKRGGRMFRTMESDSPHVLRPEELGFIWDDPRLLI